MAFKDELGENLPVFTLSCAGMALVAYLWPALQSMLVYDRAAIQGGQWWRLGTACWVHFSASHLFWDLLVFVAAGWVIQARRYRGYILLCCLTAVVPSVLLLLGSPEIGRFGGLSGPATGAVVYLCLCEVSPAGKLRIEWIAILALIALKTGVEIMTGNTIFAGTNGIRFRVLPSVHIIAFAAAVAVYWAIQIGKRLKRPFQPVGLQKHHIF